MPTISVLKRLGNRAKAPQPGHLPGEGAAQPFKAWHPSRMKTGLRNQPIGRRVPLQTERAV